MYITQLQVLTFETRRKILGLAHGDGEESKKILNKFIYFNENELTFINLGGHHDIVYKKLKKLIHLRKKILLLVSNFI